MKQQLVYEGEVEATCLISTVSHLSKVLPVFRIMSDSGNTSRFTYIGHYYGLCCKLNIDSL